MAERKKIGEVRPSQFISTFGPGAIMDLPNLSVIVAGIDSWDRRQCASISEPRLQAKLDIKKIYSPPVPERETFEGTLPVYRFPEYMVCPVCRRLDHYRDFANPKNDGVLYCHHGDTALEGKAEPAKVFPVRFIVACAAGHIHDLPWVRYVHGKQKDKTPCKDGRLTLEELGATGSITNVMVKCSCGAQRSLVDAFSERDIRTLGSCKGWRPWLGKKNDQPNCGNQLRAMLRGASNAYFPIVESALTIPPHADNPAFDVLPDLEQFLVAAKSLEDLKNGWNWFQAAAPNITPEQLWTAWQQKQGVTTESAQDLYYPEWLELLKGSQSDGAYDFETFEQDVPDLFKGFIDRLIQVRRLREVRVISGFTRIDPPADATTYYSEDPSVKPTSVRASISKFWKPDWLPGVMVRGEGIFVTLNEERLQQWEQKVEGKVGKYMEEAYARFCEDRKLDGAAPFPGVRYVLLHTLAHALMRQLGLNSGYSSTALRERIYCRTTEGQKMAGLLIYTATPDSEGSLGGLVEQGETQKFGAALWQALQEAQFCSSDPLCAEHDMKEHGDLNGAACHACTLVAETSCERSNRFLDRAFLVPTVAQQELAFFEGCI